ncbi:hypothetical protein ACNOYE_28975 [Nannocystaceae bacterium ST9]
MRDPARIPELCRLLQRAWERVPDQRLGQLLVNAVRPGVPCREVFYAEDGRTQAGLEAIARHGLPDPELPPHDHVELEWTALEEPAPTTLSCEGAREASFTIDSFFCQILELRFAGEYRHGSLGKPDADAMIRWLAVALVRSEPDVLLLDLSRLRYSWGDGIIRVLDVLGHFDRDQPLGLAVLAGPDSEAGLRSLGMQVHVDRERALADAIQQALARSVDIG